MKSLANNRRRTAYLLTLCDSVLLVRRLYRTVKVIRDSAIYFLLGPAEENFFCHNMELLLRLGELRRARGVFGVDPD
jgi:hypothetical protein